MLILLYFFLIIIFLLVAVAYFTLAERKIMATIQRRLGPNVVGFLGLLQPLADGLKLFIKETILPKNCDIILFILAPLFTFLLSLLIWAAIPISNWGYFVDLNVGVLYVLAISSLNVYGILLGGWASNSKYAFLGGLRSASQMISYELTIGFCILTVGLCAGSLNFIQIVIHQEDIWYIVPLFPLFIIFFIASLAETNRHPFDLPEAEAELVAGYNVEYSAIMFALFFLGEYANMLLMSALITILFLGGWANPFPFFDWLPNSFWFGLKISIFVVLFSLSRTILPRYRYDQLMSLGWKVLLPFSISWFFLTSSILISFNWFI